MIADRLDRLEENVTRLDAIQRSRSAVDDVLGVLAEGLAAYRQRLLREHSVAEAAVAERRLLGRVARDEALRFPHRRLLEALLAQYDAVSGSYGELPFSRLVRVAKVGKSRARGYLSLLERREYVVRRRDGYRTWFRILERGQ